MIDRTSEVIVSYRCDIPTSLEYSLKSLQLGMKALNISKEINIRVNKNGLIWIQHQIEDLKGQLVYYDFFMQSKTTEEEQINKTNVENDNDNEEDSD